MLFRSFHVYVTLCLVIDCILSDIPYLWNWNLIIFNYYGIGRNVMFLRLTCGTKQCLWNGIWIWLAALMFVLYIHYLYTFVDKQNNKWDKTVLHLCRVSLHFVLASPWTRRFNYTIQFVMFLSSVPVQGRHLNHPYETLDWDYGRCTFWLHYFSRTVPKPSSS